MSKTIVAQDEAKAKKVRQKLFGEGVDHVEKAPHMGSAAILFIVNDLPEEVEQELRRIAGVTIR